MLKVLIVVALIAFVVWSLVRHLDKQRPAGEGRGSTRRPKQEPRVMGPDDDPEFLRALERRRRHQQKDEPDSPGPT